MSKPLHRLFAVLIVASFGLAACGSPAHGGTLKIVSSLPMTGASAAESQAIVNAEKLKLDQVGNKACNGRYTLAYEALDDTLPTTGQWDAAVETSHANQVA